MRADDDRPYPISPIERACDRWFPRIVMAALVIVLLLVFLGERLG